MNAPKFLVCWEMLSNFSLLVAFNILSLMKFHAGSLWVGVTVTAFTLGTGLLSALPLQLVNENHSIIQQGVEYYT